MTAKQIERRAIAVEWDIRKKGDKVGITGYAANFNVESYGEVILPGAFDKTVAERDDVRFLVNHDGVPIARTKSGTLSLTIDEKGLIASAPTLDAANPTVAELVSAMDRGDIDQMSFAFQTIRDQMSYDDAGNFLRRELIEVKLFDVSVVTYPWYESTSAELNEFDRALVALRSGGPLDRAQRDLILARAQIEAPAPEPTIETPNDLRARRLELLARA